MRPTNLLYIMSDQHSPHVKGCYGNPVVRTPHIDALAARGLLHPRADEGTYRFRCTGDPEAFRALGTRFLQMPLGEVGRVELGEPVRAGFGG